MMEDNTISRFPYARPDSFFTDGEHGSLADMVKRFGGTECPVAVFRANLTSAHPVSYPRSQRMWEILPLTCPSEIHLHEITGFTCHIDAFVHLDAPMSAQPLKEWDAVFRYAVEDQAFGITASARLRAKQRSQREATVRNEDTPRPRIRVTLDSKSKPVEPLPSPVGGIQPPNLLFSPLAVRAFAKAGYRGVSGTAHGILYSP